MCTIAIAIRVHWPISSHSCYVAILLHGARSLSHTTTTRSCWSSTRRHKSTRSQHQPRPEATARTASAVPVVDSSRVSLRWRRLADGRGRSSAAQPAWPVVTPPTCWPDWFLGFRDARLLFSRACLLVFCHSRIVRFTCVWHLLLPVLSPAQAGDARPRAGGLA